MGLSLSCRLTSASMRRIVSIINGFLQRIHRYLQHTCLRTSSVSKPTFTSLHALILKSPSMT